jgi:hypothetical protein
MFNVNKVTMHTAAAAFERYNGNNLLKSKDSRENRQWRRTARSPAKYPYQWYHYSSSGNTTTAWSTAQSETRN